MAVASLSAELDDRATATGRSSVSRRWKRATEATTAELMVRDLSELEVAVVMIDGIEIAGSCTVVAMSSAPTAPRFPSGWGWATPRTRPSPTCWLTSWPEAFRPGRAPGGHRRRPSSSPPSDNTQECPLQVLSTLSRQPDQEVGHRRIQQGPGHPRLRGFESLQTPPGPHSHHRASLAGRSCRPRGGWATTPAATSYPTSLSIMRDPRARKTRT